MIPWCDVLGGERLHHAEQAGLGGRVGDLAPKPGLGGARGDRDDPAPIALAHPGETGLDRAEGPGQVHVDVPGPLLGSHPVRGGERVGDRGVGHADVDLPEVRQLVPRHVDLEVAALVPVEGRHVHALGAKPLGDCGADPARRTGDQRSSHSSVSWVPARPASGLLVEAAEQLGRLLRIGAAVGVPCLVAELLVERLADRVEDGLLGRAHRALGVPEDLAGDRLRLGHQPLMRDDLRDEVALQRSLGVDRLRGEQHLESDPGAAGVDEANDAAVPVMEAAAGLEGAEHRRGLRRSGCRRRGRSRDRRPGPSR